MMILNNKRPGPSVINEGGRLLLWESARQIQPESIGSHVAFQGNYATFSPRKAKPRRHTKLRGSTTEFEMQTRTEKHNATPDTLA